MYAIASVVLGGIAMSGGRGKMLGVLFGAMSYTIVDKIIVALKMDSFGDKVGDNENRGREAPIFL